MAYHYLPHRGVRSNPEHWVWLCSINKSAQLGPQTGQLRGLRVFLGLFSCSTNLVLQPSTFVRAAVANLLDLMDYRLATAALGDRQSGLPISHPAGNYHLPG